MKYKIDILKGLRPGVLLVRDIREHGMTKTELSKRTGIRYTRICEIISGKRKITLEQSLLLERELYYDEGFLMILQLYYEIKMFRQREGSTPDLSKLSPALFWDTKIGNIDWQQNRRVVIERVMTYGNETERNEITRFYGADEMARYAIPGNQRRIPFLMACNVNICREQLILTFLNPQIKVLMKESEHNFECRRIPNEASR